MKFFTRKHIEKSHNPNVDPRSQPFVDAVMKMLEEHGLDNDVKRKQCAHSLFQKTLTFYRSLSGGKEPSRDMLKQVTDKMREALAKNGITDNGIQEEIIVDYFSILTELGMSGEGN